MFRLLTEMISIYVISLVQVVECSYLHCILISGDHCSAEPADCSDV